MLGTKRLVPMNKSDLLLSKTVSTSDHESEENPIVQSNKTSNKRVLSKLKEAILVYMYDLSTDEGSKGYFKGCAFSVAWLCLPFLCSNNEV